MQTVLGLRNWFSIPRPTNSVMDLKTIQFGIVTREIQSEWGKMEVGPICDQDVALLLPVDRVCTVHQGIFHDGTSPQASEDEDVTSDSVSPSSGAVKGSSFYFGTASVVMERDEKSTKFWVRQKNLSDSVGWLRYERHEDRYLD